MNFELKWTRPFVTTHYGELVREGGSIWIGAQLAIKRHKKNEGWVCPELEKAKASLVAVSVSLTPDISIDSEPALKVVESVVEVLTAIEIPEVVIAPEVTEPVIVGSEGVAALEMQEVIKEIEQEASPMIPVNMIKCEKCPVEVPSQRKLVAHMKSAHSDARLI